MRAIRLLPLPGAEALDLQTLAWDLADALHRPVELGEALRNVDLAYDPGRDQYHSRRLLELLGTLQPPGVERILGVTGLDLFIPVLTYVFGEAQLEGAAAVVSFFRLDNRYYGLPENAEVLRLRLLKEALHELGHTYGLLHCADTLCVMRRSTYVEEIDFKEPRFCLACARAVAASIPAPPRTP